MLLWVFIKIGTSCKDVTEQRLHAKHSHLGPTFFLRLGHQTPLSILSASENKMLLSFRYRKVTFHVNLLRLHQETIRKFFLDFTTCLLRRLESPPFIYHFSNPFSFKFQYAKESYYNALCPKPHHNQHHSTWNTTIICTQKIHWQFLVIVMFS